MRLTSSNRYSFLLLSYLLGLSSAASGSSHLNDKSPCVARSPTSGLYYDLSPISLSPPQLKNGKKANKDERDESWHAKGHDYPANFTINICAPVIEDVEDVVGVGSSRWKNISAYYEQKGKIYSIGYDSSPLYLECHCSQLNLYRERASDPFFRGRKLVLNYTNGSPCPDDYNIGSANGSVRRKSTIMSFLCDRDAPPNQATPSFVGTMDSCTYYFEIRSVAACGGIAADPNADGLGPAGVFGVMYVSLTLITKP